MFGKLLALYIFCCSAFALPIGDFYWSLGFAEIARPILIFAILGLGLNVTLGYVGVLNLGVAGFMAIGAYTYSILSCDIYPFQLGFVGSLFLAAVLTGIIGCLVGLPATRLRGDYLAIVTMGFGEIVVDSIKNLESITKGIQGISPLVRPSFFGYSAESDLALYYVVLFVLVCIACILRNIEDSYIGRAWFAIKEDELAAACAGVDVSKMKLLAFFVCAAISGIAGALWALSLGSSGEPANYDFQISIMALCVVILGGLGNSTGTLFAAVMVVGFSSIFLVKMSDILVQYGFIDSSSVILSPNNWKYAAFGVALVFIARYRPEGLFSRSEPVTIN